AGEAGVPFFALSGSDFVEKYVGVGASRVRELFKKARKAGRCVIFIDEIDAMGKKRDEASSDERDQTLNALLSEMSGFYTGDGVVVIAATNRIEMLDPALLRPGRFDRQIEVGLPGKSERLSILKLHGRNKPMAEGVSFERMAAQTVGFSGASLENLLNEAAILAAARDGGVIEKEDIDRAFRKTVAGEDRPSVASEHERAIVAVHEAGHALVNLLLLPENRLARVSILPSGHGAAGYNLTIPAERVMVGKRELESQICVLLAGRAAEQAVFGEAALTAGASNDIARATELAAAMVLELGLAGEPAVSVRVLQRQCGGAGDAADGCKTLLRRLYDETGALIKQHIRALDSLAEQLLEAEALDGETAEAVLDTALSNDRRESA
ncbi:MAG: AAA family ATPase, partial [Clostridia bacterium]|nr:AAA family ATPase [Clostridia bacterium]